MYKRKPEWLRIKEYDTQKRIEVENLLKSYHYILYVKKQTARIFANVLVKRQLRS